MIFTISTITSTLVLPIQLAARQRGVLFSVSLVFNYSLVRMFSCSSSVNNLFMSEPDNLPVAKCRKLYLYSSVA